jgi:uncharacterized protein (DUF2236 family)
VSQAGLPAIVLEILHPSVVAGVQDMSNYREDPFQRARATLGYVLATTFGNTDAATALIERVKHIHSFVNGTRPDGVAYRAGSGTDRLGAHLHPVDDPAVLRGNEKAAVPT